MRSLQNLMLTLGAVVLAGGVASAATLTEISKIGGFSFPGYGGAYGLITGPAVAGKPGQGMLGAEFAGPALVSSMTISQTSADGRRKIRDLRIYTDQTTYIDVTLADTYASQVVDFTASNGGNPILAKPFLNMVVLNQYGSGDSNGGPISYTFDGTYLGPNETNLNLGIPAGQLSTTNTLGGYNQPLKVVDGNIVAIDTGNATFFVRDASNPDSLTVTYSSPMDVGSVGIALAGDTSNRDAPKWVTISDSNGHNVVVTLAPLQMQYERYDLASAFMGTTSLTITFPTATGTAVDATDWYIWGDRNYGLAEFQAFAPIPEPASLALLVLGGLALLRRRK